MEEIIKVLGIKKINFLHLDYTDDNANFKVLELDYRHENCMKEED